MSNNPVLPTNFLMPLCQINTNSSYKKPGFVQQYPDQDIALFNVFSKLAGSLANCLPQMAILALVNKKWKQEASHPFLWANICFQAGIPNPLDLNRSYKTYCYERSSLFLKTIQDGEPQIEETMLNIDIDLTNAKVHFVEDSYLIAQKTHEITVYDLKDQVVVSTIVTEKRILSICLIRDKICIALETKQIIISSLIPNADQPTSILDSHMQEEVSHMDLFANEQWLISYSNRTIEQWNLLTQKCVDLRVCGFLPMDLQLNQNRLYMTALSPDDSHLFFAQTALNDQGLNFVYNMNSIPLDAYKADFHNSTCSYIHQVLPDSYDSDSEEEEVIVMDYNTSIVTLNLQNNEKNVLKIRATGLSKLGSLRTINGLVILASDPYDLEKNYNATIGESIGESTITRPDILDFLDLQTGTSLYTIQRDMIHSDGESWSISTFQETVLYLTKDYRLVTIRFSPTLASRDPCSEQTLKHNRKYIAN